MSSLYRTQVASENTPLVNAELVNAYFRPSTLKQSKPTLRSFRVLQQNGLLDDDGFFIEPVSKQRIDGPLVDRFGNFGIVRGLYPTNLISNVIRPSAQSPPPSSLGATAAANSSQSTASDSVPDNRQTDSGASNVSSEAVLPSTSDGPAQSTRQQTIWLSEAKLNRPVKKYEREEKEVFLENLRKELRDYRVSRSKFGSVVCNPMSPETENDVNAFKRNILRYASYNDFASDNFPSLYRDKTKVKRLAEIFLPEDSDYSMCFRPAGTTGDVEYKCMLMVQLLLLHAKKYVYISTYDFRHAEFFAILAALSSLKKTNVSMTVDARVIQNSSVYMNALKDLGVEILVNCSYGLHHDKYIVIDDTITVTGSYNFTASAELKNVENMIVLSTPDVARHYKERYEYLRNVMARYDCAPGYQGQCKRKKNDASP